MEITISNDSKLKKEDVEALYKDAKWYSYTKNMDQLLTAIEESLHVVTAWHSDNLVGLMRVVGDGVSIVYIQDILVKKEYKRLGIGTKLLTRVLEKYNDVRQKVLLTDDSVETRGFYESLGFKSCDKGDIVAFAKMNK